ncbi:MAG: Na-K-Cl cotransporter, partial [Bacteroidota bacterium]
SHFYKSKRNVIILQNVKLLSFKSKKSIDIWWGGLKGNGALMMILGHLMQNSPHWQNVEICIKMVVPNEIAMNDTKKNLNDIINQFRLSFKQKVIVANRKNFYDILKVESAKKDLVMLGLKTPDKHFKDYYNKLKEETQDLHGKIFVLASQEIDFKDVLS